MMVLSCAQRFVHVYTISCGVKHMSIAIESTLWRTSAHKLLLAMECDLWCVMAMHIYPHTKHQTGLVYCSLSTYDTSSRTGVLLIIHTRYIKQDWCTAHNPRMIHQAATWWLLSTIHQAGLVHCSLSTYNTTSRTGVLLVIHTRYMKQDWCTAHNRSVGRVPKYSALRRGKQLKPVRPIGSSSFQGPGIVRK
jgi:hypothetical protein